MVESILIESRKAYKSKIICQTWACKHPGVISPGSSGQRLGLEEGKTVRRAPAFIFSMGN